MSYLVLARKWRPQAFCDVVGQESVVRTLQNGLLRNRVAHAMIFSGVRGVGKTTLARIMAKALNCQGDGEEKPCGSCQSCKEIVAGSAVDLHEIDGASNRGIQEIRELKENIRFFPTQARYKIIIIDEVHMLTTEAFNALLKTLEEPPEHVFFMFATTELHKVPITILSRCQRYELKRVPFRRLVEFFARISQDEQVDIPVRALEMIAREADGSVRDGLSLLDQVFSFGGDKVTEDDVVQVLGLVDRKIFAEIPRALLAGDLAACFGLLEKTYGAGLDLKRFSTDLLEYVRSLLICRTSSQPASLLDVSDQELAELQELAAGQSRETLSLLFQLLFKGISEMQYSSHPRLVLEMTFVKAVQAGQVVPASSLLARLDALVKEGGGYDVCPPVEEKKMAMPPKAPTAVVEAKVQVPPASESPVLAETAQSVIEEHRQKKVVVVKKETNVQGQQSRPAVIDQKEPLVAQARSKDVRQNWDGFVGYVKERKAWMAQLLRISDTPRERGQEIQLCFDNPSDCTMIRRPENLKDLVEYAQDFFQKELRIIVSSRENKAAEGDGEVADAPQEERRALANDPLVQMTLDVFGGQIGAIRTGPRFR